MPNSSSQDNSCALVLAAHGSQTEPRSALATRRHVAALQRMGLFSEVRASFWKEAPEWRLITTQVQSARIIVVPMLMSEGYFAERVLPAQLELSLELRDAQIVVTRPVGTHAGLQDAALRAVQDKLGELESEAVTIVIAGHGTSRHAQSKQSILDVVARTRAQHPGVEVLALFLDEAPLLHTFQDVVHTPHAIVLPYFIASGQHTLHDIPEALGVEPVSLDRLHAEPLSAGRVTVHYVEPVGAQPGCVDVILSRAREGGWEGPTSTMHPPPIPPPSLGELRVLTHPPQLELRHREDLEVPAQKLRTFTDGLALWSALRQERAQVEDEPRGYRALPYALPMPSGWRFVTRDPGEFAEVIELIMPGWLAAWSRAPSSLAPVSLEESLKTARGLYSTILKLDEAELHHHVRERCTQRCMKTRQWPIKDESNQDLARHHTEAARDCHAPCATLLTELLARVPDDS